jgi:(p)ppGpp synthase/HD superfamily hydrolase
MSKYQEALEFATEKHKGQTRHDGQTPYIVHPKSVADKFSDDLYKTVAILHDVVEDTDTTVQEIEEKFGKKVADAVDALSRRGQGKDKEVYKSEFLKRVVENPIARDIKVQDIISNMPTATDSMKKRYRGALLFLGVTEEELEKLQ